MRARSRKAGFNLIEVLFAMAMTLACAVIVAATMPVASVSRGKADLLNRATGLVQKQIEAIRGLGYPNANAQQLATYGLIDSQTPVTTNTYAFTNSDLANLDNPAKVLPQGSGTVTITQLDVDLVQVTVAVKWNNGKANETISSGTIIANL